MGGVKTGPCCIIGDCQRRAMSGDWCCGPCAKKYGGAPLKPGMYPGPEVFYMKPAPASPVIRGRG